MDNTKEYIVAAAYMRKEPSECYRSICKHPSLREKYGEYDDIYDLRIARHHAEILHQFDKLIDHNTDGFYTSFGRYVNRKDALKIAIDCGQVDPDHVINKSMGLDSSDIFKY